MSLLQREGAVLAVLRVRVQAFPSQHAAAEDIGISDAYLSDALLERRGIGPTILRWMGYKKIPMYARVIVQEPHTTEEKP